MSEPAAALVILVNVGVGFGLLAWTVQRAERSRFRYVMWRLRDRVVDAVITGAVPGHKSAPQWVERAEILIAATNQLTPFQYVLASRTLRRGGWSPPAQPSTLIAAAPEPLRSLLNEVHEEARDARRRLFIVGSPSGWTVGVVVLVVVLISWPVLALLNRRQHDLPPAESEQAPAPRLEKVARWSLQRYGAPADVFAPLIRRRTNGRFCEPAYI